MGTEGGWALRAPSPQNAQIPIGGDGKKLGLSTAQPRESLRGRDVLWRVEGDSLSIVWDSLRPRAML